MNYSFKNAPWCLKNIEKQNLHFFAQVGGLSFTVSKSLVMFEQF